MLRPAALQSALEALVSPTCNSALLALPESGSLYAAASNDASSSTAVATSAAAAAPSSSTPGPSALMRGAPKVGVEPLGIDERDRTLAAIGTQAWREESGLGGKNGRGSAPPPNPGGAPVLLDSELGATLIYPLRLPMAAVDSSAPIRRSSQEPAPPLLLILTSSAPPSHQEPEHGMHEDEETDAWSDLLKRARAFEEHASPALVSAFRA